MTKQGKPTVRRSTCDLATFEVFAAHTTKYETLPGLIAEGATRGTSRRTPFRILDVGCGPGHLTVPLLRQIGERLAGRDDSDAARIEYVGVDCSADAIEKLNPRLEEWRCTKPDRFSYAAFVSRIEDAVGSSDITGEFDLILCSHVLYYVPDWQGLTMRLADMLGPAGWLCVILTSSDETLGIVREAAEKAGIQMPEAEPVAVSYREWLEGEGINIVENGHRSNLTVALDAADETEKAVLALQASLAFLIGSDTPSRLRPVTSKLVSEGHTEFRLSEQLFWISSRSALRKQLDAMGSDVLTLLQPFPEEPPSEEPPRLWHDALELRRISKSIQPKGEEPDFPIEDRAAALARLTSIDPEDASSGLRLNAYMYCKRTRTLLWEDLGYRAASYIIWRGEKIVVPAIHAELAYDNLRPPCLGSLDRQESLDGLRRSFQSLLTPPGQEITDSQNPGTDDAARPAQPQPEGILEKYFPTLIWKEIERCVQEELNLYRHIFPVDAASRLKFLRILEEWIGKGYAERELLDRLKQIHWNFEKTEKMAPAPLWAFWFLAYGVFVRGLQRCTDKHYDSHGPAPRSNPYIDAKKEGCGYQSDAAVFYVPHAKVLFTFIRICHWLRARGPQGKDALSKFDEGAGNLLRRVGAVDENHFSHHLGTWPDWASVDRRDTLKELAGRPFSLTDPLLKADELSAEPPSAAFSPHNVLHYLAADTGANSSSEGRTRRAVLWWPIRGFSGPRRARPGVDLMLFVSNVDEPTLEAGGWKDVIRRWKSVFTPIGVHCLDAFGAVRYVARERAKVESDLYDLLTSGMYHNLEQTLGIGRWATASGQAATYLGKISPRSEDLEATQKDLLTYSKTALEGVRQFRAMFTAPDKLISMVELEETLGCFYNKQSSDLERKRLFPVEDHCKTL